MDCIKCGKPVNPTPIEPCAVTVEFWDDAGVRTIVIDGGSQPSYRASKLLIDLAVKLHDKLGDDQPKSKVLLVENCELDSQPGFRAGPTGKCFVYHDGNSKHQAWTKVRDQLKAER